MCCVFTSHPDTDLKGTTYVRALVRALRCCVQICCFKCAILNTSLILRNYKASSIDSGNKGFLKLKLASATGMGPSHASDDSTEDDRNTVSEIRHKFHSPSALRRRGPYNGRFGAHNGWSDETPVGDGGRLSVLFGTRWPTLPPVQTQTIKTTLPPNPA